MSGTLRAAGRYQLLELRDCIGRVAHQRRLLQYVADATDSMPGSDDW
ncbi:hypothetical protein ACE10Z_19805 [Bradyrhizobium sp. Pha-3]